MLTVLASLALLLSAGQLSTPTIGYTLSSGRIVRLTGIPGACTASFESPEKYSAIATASNSPAFVALPLATPDSFRYRSADGQQANISLSSPAAAVAISPTGSYFAALSSTHLWLFRASASTTPIIVDLAALSLTSTDINTVALGDNGDLVIATAGALWYSEAPGAPFINQPLTVSGPRFAPRDHLLVAFEPGQGRVVALHPRAGFAMEPLLTLETSGSSTPHLEFSKDGGSVWISHGDGRILRYTLATRQTTIFTVPAGTLQTIVTPGVYLWSTPDGPALLDTTQRDPAVLLFPILEEK